MAEVCARSGHCVQVWARDPAVVASINEHHKNPKYLTEYDLNANITASTSVEEALENSELCILSIPLQTCPGWLAANRDLIPPDLLCCNTAKGLYLKNGCLMSQMVSTCLGREQPYAVLSGPSFAAEIMIGHPTAVIVASRFKYNAVTIERLMSSSTFRCYTSQDVIGVELGGSLKNPLAIGAGIIEGSGMGINTMAAYITRSSLELQQLCKAMGGEPETISGLAGVGDLMLTAFGALSRNRTLGIRLTKGEKLEDILKTMTVEGVPTATVAVEFANKCNLDMPIFRAVAGLLSGAMSIDDFDLHLMGRPFRRDSLMQMNDELSPRVLSPSPGL